MWIIAGQLAVKCSYKHLRLKHVSWFVWYLREFKKQPSFSRKNMSALRKKKTVRIFAKATLLLPVMYLNFRKWYHKSWYHNSWYHMGSVYNTSCNSCFLFTSNYIFASALMNGSISSWRSNSDFIFSFVYFKRYYHL